MIEFWVKPRKGSEEKEDSATSIGGIKLAYRQLNSIPKCAAGA